MSDAPYVPAGHGVVVAINGCWYMITILQPQANVHKTPMKIYSRRSLGCTDTMTMDVSTVPTLSTNNNAPNTHVNGTRDVTYADEASHVPTVKHPPPRRENIVCTHDNATNTSRCFIYTRCVGIYSRLEGGTHERHVYIFTRNTTTQ